MRFHGLIGLSLVSVFGIATACSSSNGGGVAGQGDAGGVSKTPGGDDDSGTTESTDAGGDAGPITSGNPIGLWVDSVYSYATAELAEGGTPPPADQCPIPNSGASTGPAAFDAQGNLWAQQAGDSTLSVILWTAAELAAACSSGVPARTITLSAPDTVDQISSMAFDAHGTLWMSFIDYAVLMGVSSDQLAATGTVRPRYFIEYGGVNAQQLHAPNGLAFDTAGDLWVANLYSVLEYFPATLAASLSPDDGGSTADPPADAYLSTAASETAAQNLNGSPTGLAPTFSNVAFDKSGNLWVSGSSYGSQMNSEFIAEYAAADLTHLATNTTPTPVVVLLETAAQAANFATFGAIAFDATGNLWLGSNADLFRFPPTSLVPGDGGVGGAYDVTLTNLATLTGRSLTFNPIPAGLPIRP